MKKLPLAVIGAGAIGHTHIQRAMTSSQFQLVAIVDPSPAAAAMAASLGVQHFNDHMPMLDAARPKAVVVATPNHTHAPIAVDCLESGAAVLVEKPIADSLEDARRICDVSNSTGLPVLVGHQRRHNPIMRRAREIMSSGMLGRPVTATVMCTWFKPASYFDVAWRRRKGAGPVLINMIHDIDLMRHLYGEIDSVQAMSSNAVRGFDVEDSAAVVLRFRNGALGTVTVSDTTVAPWNWDLSAGEAERFPRHDVSAHFYAGTEGALALPALEVWRYRDASQAWQDPLTLQRTPAAFECPYAEQLRHLAALMEGREQPVCSALDGMRTLEVSLAVTEASTLGCVLSLATHDGRAT